MKIQKWLLLFIASIKLITINFSYSHPQNSERKTAPSQLEKSQQINSHTKISQLISFPASFISMESQKAFLLWFDDKRLHCNFSWFYSLFYLISWLLFILWNFHLMSNQKLCHISTMLQVLQFWKSVESRLALWLTNKFINLHDLPLNQFQSLTKNSPKSGLKFLQRKVIQGLHI